MLSRSMSVVKAKTRSGRYYDCRKVYDKRIKIGYCSKTLKKIVFKVLTDKKFKSFQRKMKSTPRFVSTKKNVCLLSICHQ